MFPVPPRNRIFTASIEARLCRLATNRSCYETKLVLIARSLQRIRGWPFSARSRCDWSKDDTVAVRGSSGSLAQTFDIPALSISAANELICLSHIKLHSGRIPLESCLRETRSHATEQNCTQSDVWLKQHSARSATPPTQAERGSKRQTARRVTYGSSSTAHGAPRHRAELHAE